MIAARDGAVVVFAAAGEEAAAAVAAKLVAGVGGMPSTVVVGAGGVSSATSSMRASARETSVSSSTTGSRGVTTTAVAEDGAGFPEVESSVKQVRKSYSRDAASIAALVEDTGAGVAYGSDNSVLVQSLRLGDMACSRGATSTAAPTEAARARVTSGGDETEEVMGSMLYSCVVPATTLSAGKVRAEANWAGPSPSPDVVDIKIM